MWNYRYSRWDGTQSVDFPSLDEIADHVAEEVLKGRDLRSVLRRMMQNGADLPQGRRMMGLRDLQERLRQARERNLQRYNLTSMFDDIQERLDHILDTERNAIQNRLDEMEQGRRGEGEQGGKGDGETGRGGDTEQGSRGEEGQGTQGAGGETGESGGDQAMRDMFRKIAERRLQQLDELPPTAGGRVKGLRDYDFMDPEARQEFEELLKELQQQMLQNYFQGLQQGIQNLTPEALREIQQMVNDLNQLIQEKLRGNDPDISEFMQKWGHLFPPGIENFDQLMEHIQRQMAQMESLLNSMPEEMRNQLYDMMEGALRDHRLQWDLMQLAHNLDQLYPDWRGDNEFPMTGDEPVTLQEALRLMGDMNSMEELERELMQAMRNNDASRVDADEVGRLLGEEARHFAEELQQLTKMLEEAGLIRRRGEGWELTPQAIRKIGDKALREIFSRIRGGEIGEHNREKNGIGVELVDETRKYRFGDPFHLNTLKTVSNAVLREGAGTPVRIKPEDFEINETISVARCSTVICIDMSYSMLATGYFQAGQRVGLALDTLIRTKFPKDQVTVMAFSYFVLPLKSNMLLDTYWVEYGGGTNFQEVLRQARQLLARQGGTTKQIIMITDGEPTTYNWRGDSPGDAFEAWAGRRRGGGVYEETLREVVRCTKDNITINTFMMDASPSLLDFVRLMAKVNHGRAFIASPDKLGTYVVADYVTNRNKVVR